MTEVHAWSIRDAEPEDAAALVSLKRAIFGETDFMLYSPGEYSTIAEDVATQVQRIRESGHSRLLVADAGGDLVGFLGVTGSPVARLRHSAQMFVGVLRAHWGRGIASALLLQAIRWAPTAGLSRLQLYVMKDNHRAIALYERLGFRVEGSRRHAYMINGKPVDDHLMAYVYEP